jgi:hypothetical protein
LREELGAGGNTSTAPSTGHVRRCGNCSWGR